MLSFYFQLLHVEHFHLASLSLSLSVFSLSWRDSRAARFAFFGHLLSSPSSSSSPVCFYCLIGNPMRYILHAYVSGVLQLYIGLISLLIFVRRCGKRCLLIPLSPLCACKIVFPFCHFPPPPRANSLTHVWGGLLLLIFWIVVSKREKKCWAISMINVFGSVRFGFVQKTKKKTKTDLKYLASLSRWRIF